MIFYFSATGNTKKLALTIAERTQDTAINMEEALKTEAFEYSLRNDERLGFCFPVYFGNVPKIVTDFVQRVTIKTAEQGYYCFVAVTSGGISAHAPQIMIQTLLKHGLTTNAAFELVTIDTFLPMFTIPTGEERQRIEAETALKTQMMAEQIADKNCGSFYKKGNFTRVSTCGMAPLYRLMRKTKYFKVSNDCNACGLCAKNCPTQAISIQDEPQKPVWKKPECMLCMRCVHQCPKTAIDYGIMTVGKTRYHVASP